MTGPGPRLGSSESNAFTNVYSNYYNEEKSKEYFAEMIGKLVNLKQLEINVSK